MDTETERELNPEEQDSGAISSQEQPRPTSDEETSTPRVYSEDEFRKAQGTADKRAYAAEQSAATGRQRLAGIEEDYKSLQDEIRQLQSERDKAEEAGAEGDDERLSVVRMRRQLREDRTALNRQKKELDSKEKDNAIRDKQAYANDIGSRYSIDPESLMSAESPVDMLSIALDAVAKERKKSQKTEQGSKQPNRYDTGVSTGGGGWDSNDPMGNIRAGC